MERAEHLKVAINAKIIPGTSGGVAQAVLGLLHALGQLSDGPEEYIIIVESQQQSNWLKPYIGPNQQILCGLEPTQNPTRKSGTLKSLTRIIRRIHRRMFPLPSSLSVRQWPQVPISDGFYESLGCDVIHFPYQCFVLCALPTVYNPHDLQHLHYPQFFTPSTIAWRETVYPAGCHLAHTIVVASDWIKQDVVHRYRLDPEKVQIIPWASPTQAYSEPTQESLSRVKDEYHLEQPFAFYPAVTWPHKNHIRLIEAIAHLRDKHGLLVHLVCTSSLYEPFWATIKKRIEELNLRPQVKFLGFVPEEDLRAIYRLSQFLIMPTLFESDSFPIFEAWLEGTPVACSTVTSLPEQVQDAGILFDPLSVDAIAAAIKRLTTDEKLCDRLAQRGRERLQDFSWERTAKAYRAVYRQAAGRPLTDEERKLLTWDWMRNTRHSEKEKI